MKDKKRIFSDILTRYIILLLIALPSLWIFYTIFTPLTIYPVYYLLSLFYETALKGISIDIGGKFTIEIIRACVAGSAYYLLTILNLSIPKIKLGKRIKILLVAFLSFLILNILRIFTFTIFYDVGFGWFDIAHKMVWYGGSILIVVIIWFMEVKYYKIKEIPFYSDLKVLWKAIK
jgi:exosortase/archaeosortase family protein